MSSVEEVKIAKSNKADLSNQDNLKRYINRHHRNMYDKIILRCPKQESAELPLISPRNISSVDKKRSANNKSRIHIKNNYIHVPLPNGKPEYKKPPIPINPTTKNAERSKKIQTPRLAPIGQTPRYILNNNLGPIINI